MGEIESSDDRARLAEVLEASWRDTQEALEEEGGRGAEVPRPEVPEPFLALYGRAMALERQDGGSDAARRRFVLEHYHGVILAERRVRVLGGAGPQATFLHAPLALDRMPRMDAALTALFECVAKVADPAPILGAASPAALIAARPTLARLFAGAYYGGYAAPLYTSDADLTSLAADHAAGEPVLTVIDRHLTGPFLHELTHFQRERRALEPPYLDECMAALIGSRVWPGLVSPEDGHDDALVGAGWFTQVGEHLALAAGFEPLLRAHAGVAAWEDVLPSPLTAVFARLGWEQYVATRHPAFLGEAQRPEPWVKAIWLAVAGRLEADLPLVDLERLPWSEVPVPRLVAASVEDFMHRARHALATRAYLDPHGAWRVARDPGAWDTAAWDEANRSWVATSADALAPQKASRSEAAHRSAPQKASRSEAAHCSAPALRWCAGPLPQRV